MGERSGGQAISIPAQGARRAAPAVTRDRVTRAAYIVGAVLIASGLFHLAVLIVTGGSWQGPVSWRKPSTFGVSFGLTLITIAWVASYIPLRRRARRWLLGAFTVACVLEVTLIMVQAWRRVPSHFNLESTVDGLISRTLAGGGAVLIAVVAVLTVASWRADPGVPASMRLAVRARLIALDVSLAVGAVMIATGVARAAAGDQQGAYAAGGALKPAHAVTMHAVLALPVLAQLLAGTAWPEPRRVRMMAVAVAGYALLAGVVVVESLASIDPLRGPILGTALAVLGALVLAGAGLLALLSLVRTRPT